MRIPLTTPVYLNTNRPVLLLSLLSSHSPVTKATFPIGSMGPWTGDVGRVRGITELVWALRKPLNVFRYPTRVTARVLNNERARQLQGIPYQPKQLVSMSHRVCPKCRRFFDERSPSCSLPTTTTAKVSTFPQQSHHTQPRSLSLPFSPACAAGAAHIITSHR